jgi:hypothetical protein
MRSVGGAVEVDENYIGKKADYLGKRLTYARPDAVV